MSAAPVASVAGDAVFLVISSCLRQVAAVSAKAGREDCQSGLAGLVS